MQRFLNWFTQRYEYQERVRRERGGKSNPREFPDEQTRGSELVHRRRFAFVPVGCVYDRAVGGTLEQELALARKVISGTTAPEYLNTQVFPTIIRRVYDLKEEQNDEKRRWTTYATFRYRDFPTTAGLRCIALGSAVVNERKLHDLATLLIERVLAGYEIQLCAPTKFQLHDLLTIFGRASALSWSQSYRSRYQLPTYLPFEIRVGRNLNDQCNVFYARFVIGPRAYTPNYVRTLRNRGVLRLPSIVCPKYLTCWRRYSLHGRR
jgi:hypothetical protein